VNYEPELILNFPLNLNFGLNTRMVGLALNHESNEKSDPYSRREWVIFHAGFEYNHLTIYADHIILPAAKNDNPDIAEFIGRGDVNIIYTKNGNIVSLEPII
jgi:phospholipase A1